MRMSTKCARRLAKTLPERARKSFWRCISAIKRDVSDGGVQAKRQPVRRTLEARELDVLMYADPKQGSKLPVKMVFGAGGDVAQYFNA